MTDDRYQQALDYLYSFVDYETEPRPRDAVNYDLRRMDELLSRLGNPHRKVRAVHIAGTKGKGSVAIMVATVLADSGYKVGLYTSPHLNTFNERIRVNDRLISDEEVVSLVERLRGEVEAVNRKAAYGQLTTFEIVTALAFTYFQQKGVDYQVVEVGLGGRLDATNVLPAEIGVITSIGFDHTEVLGDSLPEIATEKAGIIKPGSVVVVSPQEDEVAEVIEKTGLDCHASLIKVGKDVTWQDLGFDNRGQKFRVKGRLSDYELSIPLLGRHQLENAAVAVAALEVLVEKGLRISPGNIVQGMARVKWPGRLQVLSREPLLVADGAHNPYALRILKYSLKRHFPFNRAILIIGVSEDKDISGMISELAPMFDRVVVTQSEHPRALAADSLAAEFRRVGITVSEAPDVAAALTMALSLAGRKDLICVTGSLFLAGEAIEWAEKHLTDATAGEAHK